MYLCSENKGADQLRSYCKVALISFAVTVKVICVFVFAYAKCWSSRVAVRLSFEIYLIS